MVKILIAVLLRVSVVLLILISLLSSLKNLAVERQLQEFKGTQSALQKTLNPLQTQLAIDPPPMINSLNESDLITVPVPLKVICG